MANPYVTKALFAFLKNLKANNNRDWFNDHKSTYVNVVKEPLLNLITDFAPLLSTISPHFLAIPRANGGSLFRIYRDVRFSKDKSPYKTHAAIQFRHSAAKSVHAPGFYLHLEPGSVFMAMGLWQPETAVLTKIRKTIADDPETWSGLVHVKPFIDLFVLEGSSLSRPPKGFDPDHPLIEELKRKDFIGVHSMTEKEALSDDFLTYLMQIWTESRPFMEFLTKASGQSF